MNKKVKVICWFFVLMLFFNIISYKIYYATLPEVEVTSVTSGKLFMNYNAEGNIYFDGENVDVAESELYISDVFVNEGNSVNNGDVILKVDVLKLKRRLDKVNLQLSENKIELAALDGGYSDMDKKKSEYNNAIKNAQVNINELEKQKQVYQLKIDNLKNSNINPDYISDYDINVLRIQVSDAKKKLEDYTKLYEAGAVSHREYIECENNYNQLQSKLEGLERDYQEKVESYDQKFTDDINDREVSIKNYEVEMVKLDNQIEKEKEVINTSNLNLKELTADKRSSLISKFKINNEDLTEEKEYIENLINENGEIKCQEKGIIVEIPIGKNMNVSKSDILYKMEYDNGSIKVEWKMDASTARANVRDAATILGVPTLSGKQDIEVRISKRTYEKNNDKYIYTAYIDTKKYGLQVENGEAVDILVTVNDGEKGNVQYKSESEQYDLVIPKAALTKTSSGNGTVFVVESEKGLYGVSYKVSEVNISILDYNDISVAASCNKNLKDMDVVISASDSLKDGMTVRLWN